MFSTPVYSRGEPLDQQLREHQVEHGLDAKPAFWPTKIWKALLTQESIQDKLLELDSGLTESAAEDISKQILLPGDDARVLIFTIFVLFRKSASIQHMLGCTNGIRDNQLPLTWVRRNRKLVVSMRGQEPVTCCFKDWLEYELESFEDYHRRLTVPIFGLSERGNEIMHQDFDKGVVLPWCEETYEKPVPSMSGGHGTVTRVRIHPFCHNFHHVLKSINVADGLFAVKRLKNQTKIEFQNEVNALHKFNGIIHKHLVTLLATFTQEGHYHMIFPWASCDLEGYWENIEPNPDLGDIGLIRWLSNQCLGIMEAVNVIHNPPHIHTGKRYGRHGDIKAENILWYKSKPQISTGKEDRGILVISDLGLTAINSVNSRSMQPNTGLRSTPSYRPPECDMEGGQISRAFDIWTLGCLFLELLCWLLRGFEGKEEFGSERLATSVLGVKTDIFFDVQGISPDNEEIYVFTIKEAVSKKMSELHDDENCTPWMHDLLSLVENDMLVILTEDRRRKSSDSLRKRLQAMDTKCQSGESYCLEKRPYDTLKSWKAPRGVRAKLNPGAKGNVQETNPRLKVYQGDKGDLLTSLKPHKLREL